MGGVAVGCLMLLVGSWMIGPETATFLRISEIYPVRIRGAAMSIAAVAMGAGYLLYTLTFPVLHALFHGFGHHHFEFLAELINLLKINKIICKWLLAGNK